MTPTKVALVTGSGKQRIGGHVAAAQAARGYAAAVHYHTAAAEAAATVAAFQARGVEAVALQADLTDSDAVTTMLSRALAHFGRLDVLVTCAATWQRKRLEDTTASDVRRSFET